MLASACVVYATAFACGAGDDTTDGNRSDCSRGGPLAQCADIPRTSEGACTKLVQCGAIPEQRPTGPDHQYDFDWDRCVDDLDGVSATTQTLIIDCVAAATCPSLRPNMDGQIACLELGGGL